jgi:hypothetical protein
MITSLKRWAPAGRVTGGGFGSGKVVVVVVVVVVVEVVVCSVSGCVILPRHVEYWGQSHTFLLSFHSRLAAHGITTDFPEPFGWGTHWMNVLQLFGLGYKQSLGPLHFVAAISVREQTKSGGGSVGGRVGFGVDVVIGAE